MTLIIGVNLSDRLYIGADSRLTQSEGNYTDNIIKLSALSGNSKDDQDSLYTPPLTMAVAGNLNFATYMHDNINKAIKEELLSSNIRTLLTEIKEFCSKKTREWVEDNDYADVKNICMIFGGINNKENKKIDLKKLQTLKSIHIDSIPSDEEWGEVQNQLEEDVFFKMLCKKVPIVEQLTKDMPNKEKVRFNKKTEDLLENEIDTTENEDSLIFSVTISKIGVKIDIAEWGELLAFGTNGITKNDISDDFLANLEVSFGVYANSEDMTETGSIRDTILNIAKNEEIKEIGGPINTIVMKDSYYEERFIYNRSDLSGTLLNGVTKQHGNYWSLEKGNKPVRLIPFYKLNSNNEEASL